VSRTLVIRPGALGDAVLTLPLLHRLLAGGARPTILGNRASWEFLRPEWPVWDIDGRGWLWLFGGAGPARLKTSFDAAVVCLRDAGQVERALRAAGVSRVTTLTPPPREARAPHRHAALALAGVEPEVPPLAEDPFLNLDRAPRPTDRIVLHPGAGGRAKRWPGFPALAEGLRSAGASPLILLGPADADLASVYAGYEVLRDRPLRDLLSVMAGARAFVGNDSGLTHLAARCCPTFALFGPTDPAVWRPLGKTVTVLPFAATAEDLVRGLRSTKQL